MRHTEHSQEKLEYLLPELTSSLILQELSWRFETESELESLSDGERLVMNIVFLVVDDLSA